MTTQDPIDRDPPRTEESERQDPGHTSTPAQTLPESGTTPTFGLPPAGLPLPDEKSKGSAALEAIDPAPRWYDPRPFLARHVVAIARTVSVAVVVVILLVSWQGVASGQAGEDPAGEEQAGEEQPGEEQADEKPSGETRADTPATDAPREKRKKRRSRIAAAAETHFDMGKLEKYIAELDRDKQRAGSGAEGAAGRVPAPAGAESISSPPEEVTTTPEPRVVIPPVQGPAQPTSPPGSDLRPDPVPLSHVGSADLEWNDGFELALALQAEFAELQPVEISALKSTLYQHLLELSRLTGRSDNPLERMTALAELIESHVRLSVTEVSNANTLLPASVLAERRASPIGWCVIALALADRTRDLTLEPVICSGEIALRYRNGAHRYLLSPHAPDRILTNREFASLVTGGSAGAELRTLSRPEFWGHVLSEGGIDRVRQGAWARGMDLIEKGLDLDPRQPRARVAQARGFLERQEELRALECLDQAVQLDGTDRAARRARVELLLDLGRTDAAAGDLEFLARDGSDPLDTVRYARWWLERREYRRAHATLEGVLEKIQNEEVGSAARLLQTEIAAAPWIAVLGESDDDRARLRAARRLGSFPLAGAQEALIHALDDENGQLANVALAVLRQSTGLVHLPRNADLWRQALAERRSAQ